MLAVIFYSSPLLKQDKTALKTKKVPQLSANILLFVFSSVFSCVKDQQQYIPNQLTIR